MKVKSTILVLVLTAISSLALADRYSAIAVDITGARTQEIGTSKNMNTESSARQRAIFRLSLIHI